MYSRRPAISTTSSDGSMVWKSRSQAPARPAASSASARADAFANHGIFQVAQKELHPLDLRRDDGEELRITGDGMQHVHAGAKGQGAFDFRRRLEFVKHPAAHVRLAVGNGLGGLDLAKQYPAGNPSRDVTRRRITLENGRAW